MPFAKIIGPVKIGLIRNIPRFFLDLKFDIFYVFNGEKNKTLNQEKILKSFILKNIN